MNLYKVLGINRDAKSEDIRSAYRLLARRYHPDISGHQDAARFREVQLAYETLSDPESRERYDLTLQTSIPVRIIPTANHRAMRNLLFFPIHLSKPLLAAPRLESRNPLREFSV